MELRVALVRTHSPGNLGAAARAAKNFGASLALIDPRADPAHPDARAFASGAEDTLDAAERLVTLDELRPWAVLTVGLSSLRGRVERGLPPALPWSKLRTQKAGERVALVFGPERAGLSTEELRSLDAILEIPTQPALPTLNLAQAVAVALALAACGRTRARPSATPGPASSAEMLRLIEAFRATLGAAGWPGRGYSADARAELEALIRRALPSSREVTILLGALAAVGGAIDPRSRR